MKAKIFLAFALLGHAAGPAGPMAAEVRTIEVAADGSGELTTVQAAVDAVPEDNRGRVVIHIKPGTYKERIVVPKSKPFVTFKGDDARSTILTHDWNARRIGPNGREVGTGGSFSTKVNGHDFAAEGVTFENSAGDTGQALAIFADGDRLVFRDCRFLGWQDTIYANGGRQYYDRCSIEGRVDFLFGNATAVFDRCTIRSKNGGYVTAASTPPDRPFGYVFLDCTLEGEGAKAFLGRPWRPHAAVAFVRCTLGDHVRPEGWDNWRNPANEATARFAEYQSRGPGADPKRRVPWSRQLTDEDAAGLTVPRILGGPDGWDPREPAAGPAR